MSGEINDGGPAYPHEADYIRGDTPGEPFQMQVDFHPGMSLRDYFAGQVSATLLDGYITAICSKGEGLAGEAMETAAKASYMFADAMLAEREKGGAK